MGKKGRSEHGGFVGLQAQDAQLQAVRDLGRSEEEEEEEEDPVEAAARKRGALRLLAFILVLLIVVPNTAKYFAGEEAESMASLHCRKAGDRNNLHLELDADGNCVFAGMLPSAIGGRAGASGLARERKGALNALAGAGDSDELVDDGDNGAKGAEAVQGARGRGSGGEL